MANSFNVIDVYALVNEAYRQATGRNDITAVDTTTFVSAGQVLSSTQSAKETTLNVLTQMVTRTIFSVRPTSEKLSIMTADEERWGGIVRKITPLALEAEKSENFNTDIDSDQLVDGNSVDMYKIRKQPVIQLNFFGSKTLQTHRTRWMHQLDAAFTNEREFAQFMSMLMVEFYNDIKRLNDAKTRLVINNAIGASYLNGCYTDLANEYNLENGTAYTRDELLSEAHLESFMKFVVSFVKTLSDNMEDASELYHVNVLGESIIRETSKVFQRMLIFKPFMTKSEAVVMPTIFNPDKLSLGQYDTVNFWQSKKSASAVKVKPVYIDPTTAESQDAEAAVELDYVLGIIYDVEFMGVYPKFTNVSTTPLNSAGLYWNDYVHWLFNNWMDETENHHLLIIGAGGEPTQPSEPSEPTTTTVNMSINRGKVTKQNVGK